MNKRILVSIVGVLSLLVAIGIASASHVPGVPFYTFTCWDDDGNPNTPGKLYYIYWNPDTGQIYSEFKGFCNSNQPDI